MSINLTKYMYRLCVLARKATYPMIGIEMPDVNYRCVIDVVELVGVSMERE